MHVFDSSTTILLSRVADAAYWGGRYLERAEGTARLLKAHSDLLLDLPASAGVEWTPLLAVTGAGTTEEPTGSGEDLTVRSLTTDSKSQSSIAFSVRAIHHNLRVTRSVMPIEAAEVLTELHNDVEATIDEALDRRTRSACLTRIIRWCQMLAGIMSETMPHDEAYSFFTIGRQLERADLTTRVLDVEANVLTGATGTALEPFAGISWAAALRSVSALQAFRRRGVPNSGKATVQFLLTDPKCPRAVQACLTEATRWLLELPQHERPMAACSDAQRLLDGVDVADLVDGEQLHDFVDDLQLALGGVHTDIHETWFAPEPSHAPA